VVGRSLPQSADSTNPNSRAKQEFAYEIGGLYWKLKDFGDF